MPIGRFILFNLGFYVVQTTKYMLEDAKKGGVRVNWLIERPGDRATHKGFEISLLHMNIA